MEENLKQQHTDIIKIAMFGPESTGKTTLSKQLADHFDTVWAPEYAREYLQQKWDRIQQICEPEDLMPIAVGQVRVENEALLTANNYLFCDTNLLVTKVFSEMYYNFCDPGLDKAARKHKYDLFFLTDIDVAWTKDDLRDTSENREATFEVFKNALIENDKPFITLSGDENARFEKARVILKDLAKAKELGFSSHDYVQIYQKGIPLETVRKHLNIFQNGISKAILVRPATKDDGVIKLLDEQFQEYSDYFDLKKDRFKLKKFVPASGAASRMFKFLSEFLNDFEIENETINAYINRKKSTNLTVFLTGLEKFPFYKMVDKKLRDVYPDFNSWERDRKNYHFIKMMLDPDHYDFCNKPKGILPFHKYTTHIATPIEEHLNESAYYASSNGISNLHFTISETHQQQFEKIIERVKDKVEKNSGNKININFTFQNSATDTIAVDLDNNPFRNDHGKLVFRPAGHGALIDNLNRLDADIIFIKNIDNVIQNHIESIALYKKALAGILVEFQGQIFHFLDQIENDSVPQHDIEEIVFFIEQRLNTTVIEDFPKFTLENKISYIKEILNRPIRVCGMVKNEGEPGGGPFWVRDIKGNVSLQIIETSQIDILNSTQAQILASSTHFNPVDLVCGLKDFKGNKFDLHQFVDHSSGFIVEKNKNGREIKAYELPGLWNGAMSKWITLFVEVPLSTFNPVKTVNDLLKSAHQPQ
jgi:nicotinamide riboside kinase